MKKRFLIVLAAVFSLFLLNSNAIAGYLDSGWKNITIFDGYPEGYDGVSSNDWHYTNNEDNEVEPGATTGQNWDVEGFYLSDGTNENVADNELASVGGFDFVNGEPWSGTTVEAGDIFIDTVMDNGYYEYIMDIDFGAGTYSVIQNTEQDGNIQYTATDQSGISGPGETSGVAWKYASGGTTIGSNIAFDYLYYNTAGIGGGLKGYNGNEDHNIVTVNLGFLGGNTSFKVLNTMACGNDVVFAESSTAAVPEPATIFLLGSGLLGLFGYRKKLRKTNK